MTSTLVDFIRGRVGKIRADRALLESARLYRSIIEYNSDLLCRFLPGGEIHFVNDSYANFIGNGKKGFWQQQFYFTTPGEEREKIEEQLHNLSPLNPEILIEHTIKEKDGTSPGFNGIIVQFSIPREILPEYQTAGRVVPGIGTDL